MYKPGLTLYNLIDTGDINDLYQIVYNNLSPLLIKGYYPVSDNILFNDFIERFTDKYFNRYLNFYTYNMLYIKLKFVLENNKAKYKRIYEASLKEIDPLITYSDTEKIKEDTTNKGETSGSTTTKSDNNETHSGTDKNNTTIKFLDRDTESTYTPEGKETDATTTDDSKGGIKTITGSTSNPQTNNQNKMITDLEGFKFVDGQSLMIQENNFKNEHSYTNRKDTTHVKQKGEEYHNTDSILGTTYITINKGEASNVSNTKDIKDSTIERIRSGFNGNQMELLDYYSRLVFDLNAAIIADIDAAHLFMKML